MLVRLQLVKVTFCCCCCCFGEDARANKTAESLGTELSAIPVVLTAAVHVALKRKGH